MIEQPIVVLGAGLVGATIARDLASKAQVLVVDANTEALSSLAADGIATLQADLRNPNTLNKAVSGRRLAVGAVPGWLGYEVFKGSIEAGTNIVDISFFPEDPLPLATVAKDNNVRALMDVGVAPGLCNIWLGDALNKGQVNRYDCVVGGLPFERTPPWAYKAPFSPIDVIEEYTRPARHRIDGQTITRPALGNPELLEFEVGTLEAFDTDGLRTLLTTVDVPQLCERTLRWPGHRDKAQLLRDSGFFDTDPLAIAGSDVVSLHQNTSV